LLEHRYVYCKVGSQQVAEDLASSILLKAVCLLQPEAGAERMRHWLMRVVRTTLIDYFYIHARAINSSLEALQAASWEGTAASDTQDRALEGRDALPSNYLLTRSATK
jgi:DNA-directed RNA polymerase specialized sigma24 family protein